ncbi:MAG: sulfatase-like hydrolase/transferase [Phycisphaerae bacterium]|nr:sulfatase-like hydrolase/transferase [Phycisphaerae bacterium]
MKKFIFVSLLTICMVSSMSLAGAGKPNVILIMADDVSWEAFGCYGAEDYKTPNIDKMAADGIRFAHCYSTPICTPSRVKIMTGKYNFRNYTHFGRLDPKEKTFGNMMKQAGYATVIGGKWQLNGLYNAKEFTDCYDTMRPRKFGFDEHCLWQLTKTKGAGGERFWDPCLETNGKITTPADNKGKYGPDIISDYLCDFIERKKNEPFFVYYPMVLVHDPFLPTPDSIEGPYDPKPKVKGKKAGNKADEQKKNFVAMVAYMDKIIGKIIKKVDQIGQLDNTIILFTADNGTNVRITSRWNGQDIKGGKGNLKDMGTHVPLIAYWKGHTPNGVVLDDLVDFTDFYTTLADAAGIKLAAGDPIDGRSFFPQIKGEKGNPRQWAINHYNPYWGSNFKVGQFVRDAKFKLYNDGRLYNVPADLKEENAKEKAQQGTDAASSRKMLQAVLDKCPPAPVKLGRANEKVRPIYPDTPNLHEPGD